MIFAPPEAKLYEGRTVGERIREFQAAGIDPEFVDVPAAYDSRRDLENFVVDPDCDYSATRVSLVAPNGDDIDRASSIRTQRSNNQPNNAEGADS